MIERMQAIQEMISTGFDENAHDFFKFYEPFSRELMEKIAELMDKGQHDKIESLLAALSKKG